MFGEDRPPRLYALPPGVDFPREVVRGLAARLGAAAPEAWPEVTLYVNTHRMRRRIVAAFDDGPARLLPRIRLITDLAFDPLDGDPRPAGSPLRRRLELSQLVAAFLDAEARAAPRSALYDLTDSLARLIDEMHGEGVGLDVLHRLETGDLSGHWAQTLAVLGIAADWIDSESDAPAAELRQRRVVEALAAKWRTDPPPGPVIVAGSTGSRGATRAFMGAVARLPQGAVILPGVDTEMPGDVWTTLDDAPGGEDHPQYRYACLAADLGLDPARLPHWTATEPPRPGRNRLVSLALRPAPVTDQWLRDGPTLGPLEVATEGLTLVEARSPRAEAEAIALRIRAAVADGEDAILVTPDRMLTRRVEAALGRWEIVPDDSAGTPLGQTPPGRLLRQLAELTGRRLGAEMLLAVLKHPLVATGGDRGQHLKRTRELELAIRRYGPPFPTAESLASWAAKFDRDPDRPVWARWIWSTLEPLADPAARPLPERVAMHQAAAEALAAGPGQAGTGDLWAKAAGREALALMTDFARHAEAGGTVSALDYRSLFEGLVRGREVRDRDAGHPLVRFRGTLEARAETASVVILGGLVDGVWPPSPAPDPWLNRALRLEAGLLLPERQIGLSAHDFQQAIAAPEVWLTRPIRTSEAETVPSRWLNRLANLIGGLPGQGGPAALAAMRARGEVWLARAEALAQPERLVPAARRPSPRIPVEARPKVLTASDIGRLVRDPYAVYARKVLGLNALDPLTQEPDAAQRGTVIHKVLERFVRADPDPGAADARDTLLEIARATLEEECPWPTVRHVWFGRIARVADWFLAGEAERRTFGTPARFEWEGQIEVDGTGIAIKAKADRIDLAEGGGAAIYDYKTGTPPSTNQQKTFDKQLMLEAAMLDRGAFPELEGRRTVRAQYIGLGSTPKLVDAPLLDSTWDELGELLRQWSQRDRGYSARIAAERITYPGDYDHLARRGEWDDADEVVPEDLE